METVNTEKRNIELHFAGIELNALTDNIPVYKCHSLNELYALLLSDADTESIYLFGFNDDEVIVTKYFSTIIAKIQHLFTEYPIGEDPVKMFFQEYETYEDAYVVALMINQDV